MGEPEDYGYGRGGRFSYSYRGGARFHTLENEYERALHLDTVFNLDGTVVARSVYFNEEDIVQEEPFADREPDEEDYSGYTGNEGVTATLFYRDTCAPIIGMDYRLKFLIKNGSKQDFRSWIDCLSKEYRENPSDPERVTELVYLCNHVVSGPTSDSELASVVSASLLIRDKALVEKAMTMDSHKLPEAAYTELGSTLHKLGLGFLHEGGMNNIISRLSKIHERYRALSAIHHGYCGSGQSSSSLEALKILEAWIRDKVESSLDLAGLVTAKDAEALLAINQDYGNELLFRKILPFAKRHVTNTSFATAFLACLFQQRKWGKLSEEVTSSLFRDILSELIPLFEINSKDSTNKRRRTSYAASGVYGRSELNVVGASQLFVDGDAIADLLDYCLSLNLEEEMGQIVEKLENQRQTVPLSAYDDVYFPCLSKLFRLIQPRETSPGISRLRRLFSRIIGTYKKRYVQEKPARPTDWTRSARGCGCYDCGELDRFLTSPTQKDGSFRLAERRRKHLNDRLPKDAFQTITVTAGPTPYILRVTKTEVEWQQEQSAWQKRYSTYYGKIKGIGPIPLLNNFLRKDVQSVGSGVTPPLANPQGWAGPDLLDLLEP